jgi:hypothetical protein
MAHHPVSIPSRPAAVSQQPPLDVDKGSLATRLEARTVKVAPGLYRFPAGAALTADDRQVVSFEVFRLRGLLADTVPNDGGRVVEEIAEQVCASFVANDRKNSDQAIYDGYAIAFPGRAVAAVYEAVQRIIRDEAPPEYSRKFRPQPGEIAQLARAIETEWGLEQRRLERLLTLDVQEPPPIEPKMTEEERAAIRERVRRLTAGVAGRHSIPVPGSDSGGSAGARVAADLALRKVKAVPCG